MRNFPASRAALSLGPAITALLMKLMMLMTNPASRPPWMTRAVLILATGNSVGWWRYDRRAPAAKRARAMATVRAELIGYRGVLPPHPDFDRDEAAIRAGAAGQTYRQAADDLEAGSPKRAYDEFRQAQEFQPHYRDVAHRIEQ